MTSPTTPSADRVVTVEATVDRFVYRNDERAWAVVRLVVEKDRRTITAVGALVGLSPGERVRVSGRVIQNPKYGEQLEVESWLALAPETVDGIERYLGSGLVEGIGPIMAERIVRQFGLDTFDVIDTHPERLGEVAGIGRVRAERIRTAWEKQRGVKEVMIFLQSHGVSATWARRIHARYGPRATAIVRENPYRLALDLSGIGFRTADRIATSLGIEPASLQRAEAGAAHALVEASDEGHVYLPREVLIERAMKLLGVDEGIANDGIDVLADHGHAIRAEDGAIYLRALHRAEHHAANRLRAIVAAKGAASSVDTASLLATAEDRLGMQLAPKQREAIVAALSSKVVVITGGPGTGKTTIVRGILEALGTDRGPIVLAAPTGRAAKRLGETTGREAKTLHRLLAFDPKTRMFHKNREDPIEARLVIVDEASMIDIALFSALLDAVPDICRVIFVGDVDQLPSVGPGRVLDQLIASSAIPVVRLDRIFRQAEASLIIVNAHRINAGELPVDDEVRDDALPDWFFIERNEPDDIVRTIVELVKNRIPNRFQMDPIFDIQVLTPMHRGTLGSTSLNVALKDALNPATEVLAIGEERLSVGDKIMQIRNNYELGIFNGDIGRVRTIDADAEKMTATFDGRDVEFASADLDDVQLAYACSIHKAQGSEYPAVVIPMSTQHWVMLERSLLYTAVTRGKRLVVLVGNRRALERAVCTHRTRARYTRLAQMIENSADRRG